MSDLDKKLQKEVDDLKKEVRELKDNLRTIIVSQQNNSRDPFRSDRGEVILKKNAVIKSRKALIEGYDNILSVYMNEFSRKQVNAMYFGFDGGNGQNRVNEIVSSVYHDKTLPFDLAYALSNGGYTIRIDDAQVEAGVSSPQEITYIAMKTKYLTADPDNETNSSLLTASGINGFSGLGYWKEDGTFEFPILIHDKKIILDTASDNGSLEINGVAGFTGVVASPSSITVQDGIVTNVS